MNLFQPIDFGPAPNLGPQISLPAPKKKTGMFGSGVSIDLNGALAGFLAGMGNPAGVMAMQSLQQRRQQALEEQTRQQRRGEDFDDWVKKQAWEIANKPQAAGKPHYFEDNSGNLMAVGPDGNPYMVHKDPLPFKLVPNGLGGVVPVDLRTLMAGQQGPVGKITPIEGGPTPQASGGFPRPF